MEGHAAILGRQARIFFIVYYLFTVVIVCNVIVAFLIDAFKKIHPLMKEMTKTREQLRAVEGLPTVKNTPYVVVGEFVEQPFFGGF